MLYIGKLIFYEEWWILKGDFNKWFTYEETWESILGYKQPIKNSMLNFQRISCTILTFSYSVSYVFSFSSIYFGFLN